MTKYTPESLRQLDDHELVNLVLQLQAQIDDLKVSEAESSQIHNYHFASNEILKLTKDRFAGSAVILAIHSLSGKPIVKPVSISGGFSNKMINCLLDELQATFDHKCELKPATKRLDE